MIRRLGLTLIVMALVPVVAIGAGQVAQSAPAGSGAGQIVQAPTLPPTITPSQTPAAPPATATPTATFTPGPNEYKVQAGDNCIAIAYRFGHLDPAVIAAIEALNGRGVCGSLQVGQTLLVPRPTATPTQIGADLTQTAVATAAPPQVTLATGPSFALETYAVQSGDTLSSIAIIHDSSLQQICELNPLPNGIDCGACVWESPNCCCTSPIVLSSGQEINVPAPTPTPTYTPTFTGSETPTVTPTHRAPQPIFPQPGASVSGLVRLTWLSAGILSDDEHYLVTVRDDDTGAIFNVVTRQLSLDIPADFLPNDDQSHTLVWQVGVVKLGNDNLFYPVGGLVQERSFTWTGW